MHIIPPNFKIYNFTNKDIIARKKYSYNYTTYTSYNIPIQFTH